MENLGIIIGLIAIAITMIIGFITIVIMILQLGSQLRTEIKDDIKEVRDDIKATNNRIDGTNTKIDTLLVGLFRGYQYQPESPKKQDEAS